MILATSFAVTGGVPGATVRLDGKEVGQVQSDETFTHEASAGLHAIELEKTGYLPFRTQQAFALGKKIGIEGRMLPDTAAAEAAEYAAVAASTDPSLLRQYLQKYPKQQEHNASPKPARRDRVEECKRDGPPVSGCISSRPPAGPTRKRGTRIDRGVAK